MVFLLVLRQQLHESLQSQRSGAPQQGSGSGLGATEVLAILGLQGAEADRWLIAAVEAYVAPGVQMDGLATAKVLEVIDGYVLVRMLDGEPAEIAGLLIGCEIRLGEGAIPAKVGIKAVVCGG